MPNCSEPVRRLGPPGIAGCSRVEEQLHVTESRERRVAPHRIREDQSDRALDRPAPRVGAVPQHEERRLGARCRPAPRAWRPAGSWAAGTRARAPSWHERRPRRRVQSPPMAVPNPFRIRHCAAAASVRRWRGRAVGWVADSKRVRYRHPAGQPISARLTTTLLTRPYSSAWPASSQKSRRADSRTSSAFLPHSSAMMRL